MGDMLLRLSPTSCRRSAHRNLHCLRYGAIHGTVHDRGWPAPLHALRRHLQRNITSIGHPHIEACCAVGVGRITIHSHSVNIHVVHVSRCGVVHGRFEDLDLLCCQSASIVSGHELRIILRQGRIARHVVAIRRCLRLGHHLCLSHCLSLNVLRRDLLVKQILLRGLGANGYHPLRDGTVLLHRNQVDVRGGRQLLLLYVHLHVTAAVDRQLIRI